MELLDIDSLNVLIPTTNNKGCMSWEKITKITRHDPSDLIYIIKTKHGREVKVVESKSLLIWNEDTNSYEPKLTTEVEVGDYVPVSINLENKNVEEILVINMETYLPKTEYIYGTDFNIAKDHIFNKHNSKVPRFWWNNNNNNIFTLPYTNAHQILRVERRSNIDVIKDGYIFPYKGTRGESLIEDKFILDRDNGFFIGLYIAEGHSCVASGKVCITNNDEIIMNKVKEWFDKRNIVHKVYSKTNGTWKSTTIQGSTTVLAKFLNKFVGNGARNKFIPAEAFLAPDEFIIGLLDGYYSGDGHISKNSIDATSASKELIEGISMLLSRFGIFSKMSTSILKKNNFNTENIAPINRIAIRSKWAVKFSQIIKCTHPEKAEKLELLGKSESILKHQNMYEIKEDTILDEIISIETVSSDEYPKVYDLTIPATKNFGLANGLQVYDTSEVGYIQRKLVKAMEDCKISYDLTVRNASGSIIQFLYGEDAMSSTKLESQKLEYIDMDKDKILQTYLFTKEDVMLDGVVRDELEKELRKNNSWEEKSINFYKQILEDRTFMIEKIFKMQYENKIIYPVSLYRLIQNTKQLFHPIPTLSDLHPSDIIDELVKLEDENSFGKYNKGTKLFGMLLRAYLAPKRCIMEYKLNKLSFEYIMQQIRLKFKQAIAHPSEMVGVIAAQSIGEPTTQLSCSNETKIIISGKNKMYNGEIGNFIDKILKDNDSDVIELGNDSVVYQPKEDYHIIGVTNNEKTHWNRILEVSRHRANGNLVKVTTKTGKTTTATLSHSFLKRTENSIEAIKGVDLKLGDRIPCAKFIPEINEPINVINISENMEQKLNKDFGIFIGSYLADGNIINNNICITKNAKEVIKQTEKIADDYDSISKIRTYSSKNGGINIESQNIHYNDKKYETVSTSFNNKELAQYLITEFSTGSFKKRIPAWVFSSNKEFIFGILSGYFNGDGNVNGIPGKQVIRCHSVNEKLIIDMCLLLTYAGIFASKGFEKKTNGGNGLHALYITQKYAQIFKDLIGFSTDYKIEELNKVIEHQNREDKHSDKEEYDKIPELGNIIAYLGKKLVLPAQSRTYGRWAKKTAIGRKTLQNYIPIFENANEALKVNPEYRERINNKFHNKVWTDNDYSEVLEKINILKQAAYSDIVWDEIVKLETIEDDGSYVYDFTVPGNDSFMVDCGILVHNTLNTLK
jgi:intein/homing endonuclease